MNYELCSRTLPLVSTPDILFQMLFAKESYAFWLDSSRYQEGEARFSFMGAQNGPEAYRIDSSVNGQTVLHEKGEKVEVSSDIFSFLEQRLTHLSVKIEEPLPFDFHGGFLGYFGYELMAVTEGIKGHTSNMPDTTLLFVDRFLAIDHKTQKLHLVALHRGDPCEVHAWFGQMENAIASLPSSEMTGARTDVKLATPSEVESYLLCDRETYLSQISYAQQMILDGESYEVCLTNRVRVPLARNTPNDLLDAYLDLRRINPAPYAAFLRFGPVSVLSSSPERFLKITPDGMVETKPIKGTTPRSAAREEDDANRRHLLEDEHYFSENLMIVDLLRNDLNKSCVPGSVHVPALMQVESYATVHQLVSTIRGSLKQQSALQCIAGCFPGGSMTGAPKRRTLEIIQELEQAPRGIYSGAIGYLSLNGAVDLNIVIRTIVVEGARAEIGVGGAIIHLSEPEKEYKEMLLKSLAPFSAILPLAATNHQAISAQTTVEPV